MNENYLTYTKQRRGQARDRSAMAAMIDIDSFVLALDDIEFLETKVARLRHAMREAVDNCETCRGETGSRRCALVDEAIRLKGGER